MANLKFYFTPGSCSTGIHILLEEIGLVFEAYLINLVKGDQHQPDYLAINPHGTIPTLVREDGSALTDFVSIARWLAQTYPRRKLLPESAAARAQVLELMQYVVNTIHGQGFTRIFTTEKYSDDPACFPAIIEQGRQLVSDALASVDSQLAERFDTEFVNPKTVNPEFSNTGLSLNIADAALFYVEFWADRIGMTLPTCCLRHYQWMLGRTAVRQVLMEEGYHSVLNQYDKAAQRGTYATA